MTFIELKDKSKVRVFIKDGYYSAFVSLPPENNIIYSIQVTGDKTDSELGLGTVRLGDQFKKVLNEFGEPTLSRIAIDQETGSEIKKY